MLTVPAPSVGSAGVFAPDAFRVVASRRETEDVVTLSLEPAGAPPAGSRPGQFNMVTAFGIGEAAISVSSQPGTAGPLQHTVRDVGPVSHALCSARVGDLVGVRGPFGNDWGVERLAGKDVLVMAGGIGLAPLRGAVLMLLDGPRPRTLTVLVGARSPEQVVFGEELLGWREAGADVRVAVDVAAPGFRGAVGVVTNLLATVSFDPQRAVALVCGPEVMMRFGARALVDRGVAPDQVRVSLERNMQCAVGLCGHCQLGPLLLCRDGPVVDYAAVARLLSERER
jgi:anaerobic sulfite reductase subunit B